MACHGGDSGALKAFGDRERGSLAHIRAHVRGALLDREHDEAADHGDAYAAEHAQRHRADERAAIGEVALEGVDREEGEVGLRLGVAQEVDVHELADFEVVRGDVLDDLGEVLGDVAALGDELDRGGEGVDD